MKRSEFLLRILLALPLLFLLSSRGSSQIDWYFLRTRPLISPGYAPRVLKLDAERWGAAYHCWYAAISGDGWDIYHAVSDQGTEWLTSWVTPPIPAVPRGSPGDFDALWAIDPCVVQVDTQLVMYYTGHDSTKWQTGVAFSVDGITWTKYSGNPVLRVGSGWESTAAVNREVIENPPGSLYRFTMYYIGYDGSTYRTGIAYSGDGLAWEKSGINPILDVGPQGAWDEEGVMINTLIIEGGVKYMFYMAPPPSPLGVATSTDGVTWTRYRRNPILWPPSPYTRLGFGSMLLENGTLRYWFGGEQYGHWSVLYAASPWNPDIITGVTEPLALAQMSLDEPFPNPCNPSTTIRYGLAESRDVRLSVYDMLGQEVRVLVDEQKEAGYHEVRFDGSGLASGVYFSRLTAGDYVQTRRIVLLR